MLHVVMTAPLEDVPEAHQVCLDVGRRILDRITHPRLGRQVHHPLRAMLREGPVHCLAILQIRLDQRERCARAGCGVLQTLQPGPLQSWVVVGVEIVKANHRRAPLQQPGAEVEANETCRTGDKNAHGIGQHRRAASEKGINRCCGRRLLLPAGHNTDARAWKARA